MTPKKTSYYYRSKLSTTHTPPIVERREGGEGWGSRRRGGLFRGWWRGGDSRHASPQLTARSQTPGYRGSHLQHCSHHHSVETLGPAGEIVLLSNAFYCSRDKHYIWTRLQEHSKYVESIWHSYVFNHSINIFFCRIKLNLTRLCFYDALQLHLQYSDALHSWK